MWRSWASNRASVRPRANGCEARCDRRWLKENLYGRAPLFWRAGPYWFHRYVLRLGFLDGRPGLVFHFLQAFWYRFLVDAKIWERRWSRLPCSHPDLRTPPD